MWTLEEVEAHIAAHPTSYSGPYHDNRGSKSKPWVVAIRNGLHVAHQRFPEKKDAERWLKSVTTVG